MSDTPINVIVHVTNIMKLINYYFEVSEVSMYPRLGLLVLLLYSAVGM